MRCYSARNPVIRVRLKKESGGEALRAEMEREREIVETKKKDMERVRKGYEDQEKEID
jgi:hypothetical protein